jgi:hypothetical protein
LVGATSSCDWIRWTGGVVSQMFLICCGGM